MLDDPKFAEITDVVVTAGTAGTCFDMALANYWAKSGKKIHGIRVGGYPKIKYYYKRLEGICKDLGLDLKVEDILTIHGGHEGPGYAKTNDVINAFSQKACADTGIPFDTCYTTKGLMGLAKEIEIDPSQFAGRRVLFVMTGGCVEFLSDSEMMTHLEKTNKVDTVKFI